MPRRLPQRTRRQRKGWSGSWAPAPVSAPNARKPSFPRSHPLEGRGMQARSPGDRSARGRREPARTLRRRRQRGRARCANAGAGEVPTRRLPDPCAGPLSVAIEVSFARIGSALSLKRHARGRRGGRAPCCTRWTTGRRPARHRAGSRNEMKLLSWREPGAPPVAAKALAPARSQTGSTPILPGRGNSDRADRFPQRRPDQSSSNRSSCLPRRTPRARRTEILHRQP